VVELYRPDELRLHCTEQMQKDDDYPNQEGEDSPVRKFEKSIDSV